MEKWRNGEEEKGEQGRMENGEEIKGEIDD